MRKSESLCLLREFMKQYGSNCYFSCNFKGYEEYSPTIEGNFVIQIPFLARYRLKIYAYIVVYEGGVQIVKPECKSELKRR